MYRYYFILRVRKISKYSINIVCMVKDYNECTIAIFNRLYKTLFLKYLQKDVLNDFVMFCNMYGINNYNVLITYEEDEPYLEFFKNLLKKNKLNNVFENSLIIDILKVLHMLNESGVYKSDSYRLSNFKFHPSNTGGDDNALADTYTIWRLFKIIKKKLKNLDFDVLTNEII